MTHLSSFRYGEPLQEKPSESRGCSEVRISYFDPATGEPCSEKPRPLSMQREEGQTSQERNAKRMADIEEAAEIMRSMKARRTKENKGKKKLLQHSSKKRPVLVDGVRYQSVAAAAEEIGTPSQYLGKQLLSGKRFLKGRRIEFAEVER